MIYVLEDDASIQKLVVYTLNSQGMEARGFDRPSQFWSALALEKPELVLLDIMLPEEDGLQVLKKLRADPATRRTPVLMLTAKSTEYDKVLGLDQHCCRAYTASRHFPPHCHQIIQTGIFSFRRSWTPVF